MANPVRIKLSLASIYAAVAASLLVAATGCMKEGLKGRVKGRVKHRIIFTPE